MGCINHKRFGGLSLLYPTIDGYSIWANYNDLTILSNPGIMVNKGNHPKMAELFRLVNY